LLVEVVVGCCGVAACLQQKLGAQLERIIGNVTGARTIDAEIQEGDVPAEPEPKVQVVEDDDGE
jgi:hypothetical protein